MNSQRQNIKIFNIVLRITNIEREARKKRPTTMYFIDYKEINTKNRQHKRQKSVIQITERRAMNTHYELLAKAP
ncbi:TPA_asm: hypothetical protein G0G78_08680 [Salmonella enterica]|nr:hypothetical protein [Salmonella enterica]HAC8270395.1 hypothetical protein [Salmonella enterica]